MAETPDNQHQRALEIAKAIAVVAATRPNFGQSEITKLIEAVYLKVRELDKSSSQRSS